MVTVEITKDTNKRYCAVCKRKITKRSIIVKYDEVIDEWNNTRMWFAHIECLIKKLKTLNENAKKELKKIPRVNYEIHRYTK